MNDYLEEYMLRRRILAPSGFSEFVKDVYRKGRTVLGTLYIYPGPYIKILGFIEKDLKLETDYLEQNASKFPAYITEDYDRSLVCIDALVGGIFPVFVFEGRGIIYLDSGCRKKRIWKYSERKDYLEIVVSPNKVIVSSVFDGSDKAYFLVIPEGKYNSIVDKLRGSKERIRKRS